MNQNTKDTPMVFHAMQKRCLFILMLLVVSLIPCIVQASPIFLFDLLPKTVNGENGVLLQSRTDTTYRDLEFLPNAGDYWFGTSGAYQGRPLITRGEFSPGIPRDRFAIYAFPSNVNQTGLKADAVIRWKLPEAGNRIHVTGNCLREGRNPFPIRFYIYIGPGRYQNPLWETVNGGDFNLLLNYSAGDEIFFAAESVNDDTEIRAKWTNVSLAIYSDTTIIETISQPEGKANQSQTPPISAAPEIPLMFIVIGSAVLLGGVAFFVTRRYRAVSDLEGGSSEPLSATESPQKDLIKRTQEDTPAGEGSIGIPAKGALKHHDVFICYANPDKPVADAVCAYLESHSIRCWIAPRDVLPGENFPESIIGAIEESRIMVLVFSSHANSSQHVLRELTKAVSKGVIIIPFRIEDAPLSKSMEYLIGLPHWLDAITPPLERHIDTLVNTVDILLKRT
jgi:hypothetical protein